MTNEEIEAYRQQLIEARKIKDNGQRNIALIAIRDAVGASGCGGDKPWRERDAQNIAGIQEALKTAAMINMAMSKTSVVSENRSDTVNVFISHINEEASMAKMLKDWIESTFAGQYSVFVSSDGESIPPGSPWVEKLDQALDGANAVLVLCSPVSVKRPWVNFEAGCGFIKRVPVIPICHSGLRKNDLPMPLSLLQAQDIEDAEFAESLILALATLLGVSKLPRISYSTMQQEIRAMSSSLEDNQVESENESAAFDDAEIKILQIIASSSSQKRSFPLIVRELGESETKTQYYLDKLTQDKKFLRRSMNARPDIPDMYSLSREGRSFLIEGGYVD